MQPDVRRELGQDVGAGEEQSISAVVEADVAWRMAWRPLDTEPSASHLNRFGAVDLHRRLRRLHDLAQRALRVAQDFGFVRGHSVDAQVMQNLLDQMLELDVARMHDRDFEATDVEDGEAIARERARRSVA